MSERYERLWADFNSRQLPCPSCLYGRQVVDRRTELLRPQRKKRGEVILTCTHCGWTETDCLAQGRKTRTSSPTA
jgi:C4-type Zn-finger protein